LRKNALNIGKGEEEKEETEKEEKKREKKEKAMEMRVANKSLLETLN